MEAAMTTPASMPELPVSGGSGSASCPTKTSQLAVWSLVLGIASLGCSCLTGIPGIVCGILGLNEIGRSEREQTVPRITGRGLAIGGIVASSLLMLVWVLATLVGLLLPAIQSARDAARRSVSMNNIKMLELAMLMNADARGFLPAAIVDQDGAPLLSWRVAILPFLDEAALYEEFHLDEPWDSPHNIKLLNRMPDVFERAGERLPAGATCYLAAAGPGMILGDPKMPDSRGQRSPWFTGRALRDVADGTSKTVLLLEVPVEAAVPWTKPVDWTDDPAASLSFLATARRGLFLAGFADGSVGVIGSKAAPDAVRAAFTRAGGDFFDGDDLQ